MPDQGGRPVGHVRRVSKDLRAEAHPPEHTVISRAECCSDRAEGAAEAPQPSGLPAA